MTSKNQVRPCNECAFRRSSPADFQVPGTLGGSPPTVYIGQTQGNFMIPCHKLCDFKDPNWRDKAFETGQCAGAAVYRANLGLTPPEPINTLPADHEAVFSSHAEFLAHHTGLTKEDAVKYLEIVTPDRLLAAEKERAGVRVHPDEHRRVVRAALEAGQDPHKAWAAVLFRKEPRDVTPEERRYGKQANFTLLYSTDFMATVRWPRDGAPTSLN